MARESDCAGQVVLGRITGLHGIQGWLKIHSYTRPPQGVFEYPRWWVQRAGQWQVVGVADWRRHGNTLLVKLEDLSDRDQARAWLGCEVSVPRSILPELPAGEYYWTDLLGLRVLTLEGVELGIVDHLLETGSNDVLVVSGERERLIPFVPGQHVVAVDLDAKTIRVDWDPQF